MSELISGKEAKLAWANGEELQFFNSQFSSTPEWKDLSGKESLNTFDAQYFYFRLKPRTISLNGIEVPAPFEPKEGDDCRCFYIETNSKLGYDWYHCSHYSVGKIAWRTEEEVKQVVAALRSVFKGV